MIVVGRHDYGFPESQSFVRRLRSTLIPAARFPAAADVRVGGGPAQGVDFLHQAYRYFVPLVVAVLLLTYLLLMRAFRSLLVPAKAVLLNLLSVAASYGMLVVVFRWGLGHDLFGLYQFGQIEGWIPIFLFAMLFGLSMDYEVFIVTRMRESWDSGADNETAVAHGLERTGRIITAAAVIMCAAFSGFVAGTDRRPAGVRARARGRDLPRRHDRPLAARAEHDGAPRAVELVAAAPPARVVRVAPSPLEPARARSAPGGCSIVLTWADEGADLRRRDGDAARGADARHEQAPAAGRPLADGLLPAPAAATGRRPRGADRHRQAARGRLHRPARRRAACGARSATSRSSIST